MRKKGVYKSIDHGLSFTGEGTDIVSLLRPTAPLFAIFVSRGGIGVRGLLAYRIPMVILTLSLIFPIHYVINMTLFLIPMTSYLSASCMPVICNARFWSSFFQLCLRSKLGFHEFVRSMASRVALLSSPPAG